MVLKGDFYEDQYFERKKQFNMYTTVNDYYNNVKKMTNIKQKTKNKRCMYEYWYENVNNNRTR